MSSEVISRLISELKPHPRNYNNHSDRQVDDLALSLKRFGQRKPIVTWRDMIVAGHGLTMAAQMAGWTSILTMPIPDDWDEATVLAYLAADNELARQADPDLAQLAAITKELEGIDEELAKLAAGGDDALKALMATIEDEKPNGDTGPQIDKAEELRVKWDVELGQMWRLPSRDGKGEHRIICGDCTDRAVVERLMQGEKADLCLTDPPYGIAITRNSNRFGVASDKSRGATNDSWDDNVPSKTAFDFIFEFSKNQIVFGANYFWEMFYSSQCYIVWDKRGDMPEVPFCDTEFAWTSFVEKMSKKYQVINHGFIKDDKSEVFHPTQKPLILFEKILLDFSPVAAIVYEPFSGSGTTLIACENLSRKARAVEISPAYVAVAIQRWVDVTGKEPILL